MHIIKRETLWFALSEENIFSQQNPYDITCEVEQYMTEYIWFLSYAMEEGRNFFLCQISNTNNQ